MSTKTNSKKKSRHFTIVVRRQFLMSPEKTFDAWIDPVIRNRVLSHRRYKNGVKEVNPIEGGIERYEDRWRNRLFGQTTRRYLVIRRPKIIVAQVEKSMEIDMIDQHFASQELMLFKPNEHGTEIVASSQCVSIEPTYIHSAEDSWNDCLDIFEQIMKTESGGKTEPD